MQMLQSLNPEQLAAVTLPNEHALILAGAGSGKTRVLTTRIAWLLQTGQISPGGLLAVTFTNKAAKEMLLRLTAMLPVNTRGMWIGTFHGLCNRLLRAHYKLANLPQAFQILDTQDQLSAIKRLMKQHGVDEERFPPKQVQWFIAGAKEEGQRPKDLSARDAEGRRKIELYALYEEQCQREGVVDFAELMLRSYELLRDSDALREHYQRRFQHVLIDEFQDTNSLQYAWIKLLTGPHSAVFAVGDDDQSIYAFRGARVSNMLDFVREFGVRHQVKLELNYRSHGNILDSANHLIDHNSQRLGKNLRTEQGAGEPVRVYESPSDLAEAQWVVEELSQLVASGTPRHEVALLYRSNAQSRVLETALFNAGLPYRVYGGLRFFERAEIKHALAYLRLLENPRDDTSFMRVVNFPPRGIGARSIEQLQDAARESGCALADAVSLVAGKAGTSLSAFIAKLDVLREQSLGLTLREIVALVLEHSGLIEHYQADKEGADRVENLQELLNAAESFVSLEGFGKAAEGLSSNAANESNTSSLLSQSPASQGLTDASGPVPTEMTSKSIAPDFESGETMSPLAAFLSHAALEAGDNQAQAGQDAVQLMTVHSAKGLEFDCVFITGLEEGLFPHENSLNERSGIEEERRLMYVAITRARQRLYLCHSQTRLLHGSTRYNLRSRFFDELPEGALKWLSPAKTGFASGLGGNPGNWRGNAYAGGAWGGAKSGGGYGGKSASNWGAKATSESAWWNESKPVVQKSAPTAQAHGVNITVGMAVFHNKFGEGKVLTLEGVGDDARAQVSFARHGTKWLALAVAKLTPI
jgi:DNA helicase II / ATP-dependent DNA helicase PcrA